MRVSAGGPLRAEASEQVGGEESGRHGRVDVDHGEGNARLEHRSEGGLPASPAPVADRDGDPDNGGADQTRDDRGEGALPSREHEVAPRAMALQLPHGAQEAVQPRHADVVSHHGSDPEFVEYRSGFFSDDHVARPRGDERDRPPRIVNVQWSDEPEHPSARELPDGKSRRPFRPEASQLSGGGAGDDGAFPLSVKRTKDADQMLGALALREHYLGDPGASRPRAIEASVSADRELGR